MYENRAFNPPYYTTAGQTSTLGFKSFDALLFEYFKLFFLRSIALNCCHFKNLYCHSRVNGDVAKALKGVLFVVH